jgi:hypothetical protein
MLLYSILCYATDTIGTHVPMFASPSVSYCNRLILVCDGVTDSAEIPVVTFSLIGSKTQGNCRATLRKTVEDAFAENSVKVHHEPTGFTTIEKYDYLLIMTRQWDAKNVVDHFS